MILTMTKLKMFVQNPRDYILMFWPTELCDLWVYGHQHIPLLSLGKVFSSYSKLHRKLHLLICLYTLYISL